MTEKKSVKKAVPQGPFVYIGTSDPKRQLYHITAYDSMPTGVDAKLFISLAELPVYLKKK